MTTRTAAAYAMAIAAAGALAACLSLADIQPVRYEDHAPTRDGSNDASTNDAGTNDASDAVFGPEECPPPSFCDSFDRPNAKGEWTEATEDGGRITTDAVHSAAGRALHASTLATFPNVAFLRRTIEGTPSIVRVSFWLFFDAKESDVRLVSIVSQRQTFTFLLSQGTLEFWVFKVNGAGSGRPIGAAEDVNGNRFSVEIRTGATTALFRRGDDAGSEMAAIAIEGPYHVEIGANDNETERAANVWLDDVRIDVTP